jgi:hypothetical protein
LVLSDSKYVYSYYITHPEQGFIYYDATPLKQPEPIPSPVPSPVPVPSPLPSGSLDTAKKIGFWGTVGAAGLTILNFLDKAAGVLSPVKMIIIVPMNDDMYNNEIDKGA